MVIFLKFYLIGIKGSGMSALANILLDDNYIVEGCDIDSYIFTETCLRERNVNIYSLNHPIPDDAIIIIGHDFVDKYIKKVLKQKSIPYFEYNDFLDFYINKNKLICVSGSHGKTTIVGLLSTAIKDSSFLRGDGTGNKSINEDFFFLESCEYKDHYQKYNPKFIVISNIDYDHVDYFKKEEDYINSFKKFANKVSMGLIHYDYISKINNPYFFTYGLSKNADFYVENYVMDDKGIKGEVYFQKSFIGSFENNNLFGINSINNVLCVFAFAYIHGLNIDDVSKRIRIFKPAKKRFNVCNIDDQIYIDDYAHHPVQIENNISNVNIMFKDKIKVGIFKPDRISRIKMFKNEIINALNKFDKAFIVNFNDEKYKEVLKSMSNDKIVYLDKIEEITSYINPRNKYVFSLMSSKSLDDIKKILITHLNN